MTATSIVDRTAPSAPAAEPLEDRIVEAMLDCIGRWGIAKTTADDIARRAGVSRATLYRVFPGGKDVAFDALLRHETARFFAAVNGPLGEAATLEDTVVIAFVEAARFVLDHGPLQYVLTHEPERVMPLSAVHGLERAFAIARDFAAPHLRRFVADDEAADAGADWMVRQFFTYALIPRPGLTLTNEADVRRFVRTYLLPALTNQEI